MSRAYGGRQPAASDKFARGTLTDQPPQANDAKCARGDKLGRTRAACTSGSSRSWSETPTCANLRRAACGFAKQNNFVLPARLARIIGGWALTRSGEPGRGADQMEAAYRELLEAKQRAYLTLLGTLVARHDFERRQDALFPVQRSLVHDSSGDKTPCFPFSDSGGPCSCLLRRRQLPPAPDPKSSPLPFWDVA